MRGSIPPVNRVRRPLSSMRVATATDLVFVGPIMGGSIGSASRSSAKEPEYKPHVTAPKPEVQQARKDLQAALADKRAFWRGEVSQLIREFGKSILTPALTAFAGDDFKIENQEKEEEGE